MGRGRSLLIVGVLGLAVGLYLASTGSIDNRTTRQLRHKGRRAFRKVKDTVSQMGNMSYHL